MYGWTHARSEFLKALAPHGSNVAILCGAGISVASGLPSVAQLLPYILKAIGADTIKLPFSPTRIDLLEFLSTRGARLPHRVPIRFEGFMEILQRVTDEQLSILDAVYFGDSSMRPSPNPLHQLLGQLACTQPVVSTNFDILIEASLPQDSPVPVIWADWPERAPHQGLYKIHGTTRILDGEQWVVDSSATPAATLRSIARSRHDSVRSRFFRNLLEKNALVVVGYSGADDFDLSNWLMQYPCDRGLYWIAFNGRSEPGLNALLTLRDQRLGPVTVLDLSDQPEAARSLEIEGVLAGLLDIASPDSRKTPVASPREKAWDWKVATDAWLAKYVHTSWHRKVVCGALLGHVSQFEPAANLLNNCLEDIDPVAKPNRVAFAQLLLAESLLETGKKSARQQALTVARSALDFFVASSTGRSRRTEARVTYAKALRLTQSFEEAFIELSEIAQDKEVALPEKARAVAELYRLNRLWKGSSIDSFVKEAREHDLFVEALIQHETAKGCWRDSHCPEDLEKQGCIPLRDAADLRARLGDTDGLCATENVLGGVYLAMADWYDCVGEPSKAQTFAAEALKHIDLSEQVARNHGLTFHIYSAKISRVVYGLWYAEDVANLGSTERDLTAAASFDGAHALERFRIRFMQIAVALATSRLQRNTIDLAKNAFVALANEAIGPSEGARRDEYYLALRARFNAGVCSYFKGDSSVAALARSAEYEAIAGRAPYWNAMVIRSLARLQRANDGRDIVRALLPPIPGMAWQD